MASLGLEGSEWRRGDLQVVREGICVGVSCPFILEVYLEEGSKPPLGPPPHWWCSEGLFPPDEYCKNDPQAHRSPSWCSVAAIRELALITPHSPHSQTLSGPGLHEIYGGRGEVKVTGQVLRPHFPLPLPSYGPSCLVPLSPEK